MFKMTKILLNQLKIFDGTSVFWVVNGWLIHSMQLFQLQFLFFVFFFPFSNSNTTPFPYPKCISISVKMNSIVHFHVYNGIDFIFIQVHHMYAPLVQLKLWLVIHLLCIAHFPAIQLSLFDGKNQARNLYQVKLIEIYDFCLFVSIINCSMYLIQRKIDCICCAQHFLFSLFQWTTGTKYELSSIQNGGALKIHQVDSSQDSGIYTCVVGNRAAEEARRDFELTVNSKLMSFSFNAFYPFLSAFFFMKKSVFLLYFLFVICLHIAVKVWFFFKSTIRDFFFRSTGYRTICISKKFTGWW